MDHCHQLRSRRAVPNQPEFFLHLCRMRCTVLSSPSILSTTRSIISSRTSTRRTTLDTFNSSTPVCCHDDGGVTATSEFADIWGDESAGAQVGGLSSTIASHTSNPPVLSAATWVSLEPLACDSCTSSWVRMVIEIVVRSISGKAITVSPENRPGGTRGGGRGGGCFAFPDGSCWTKSLAGRKFGRQRRVMFCISGVSRRLLLSLHIRSSVSSSGIHSYQSPSRKYLAKYKQCSQLNGISRL